MLSPIRTSAETGDGNNQPFQPNTKGKTTMVKKKSESNTSLSTNNQLREAENTTESQKCHLTSMKQRDSGKTEQPAIIAQSTTMPIN